MASTRKKTPSLNELRKARAAGQPYKKERASVHAGERNTAVLLGDDDPRTWTDEELLRGRRADRNGRFMGRDPLVVPKAVHDEFTRRVLSKTRSKLTEALEPALEQLVLIVNGQDTEDKDRLKAIQIVLERTMGRTPDRLEVGPVRQPWEDLVVDAIVPGFDDDDDEG